MSLLSGEHIIMLNKSLCKKCWQNTYNKWFRKKARIIKKQKDYENAWEKQDGEENWEKEIIYCPPAYRKIINSFRKTTAQPPEKCPYFLEQILTKEENKNAE